MEPAYALSDAPKPISATSLDPYGQLLRMLLPRAQSIVFCDRAGVTGFRKGVEVSVGRLLQNAEINR